MSTDVDIQLSDMLESYPSIMTPGFQTLITAKKEFSELASDPFERLPPGRGHFFKHQKLVHRYLRAYDDLLVMDSTGSGKSCTILGGTEYFRQQLEKSKLDPTSADEKSAHYKQVIILVKGPTQKQEIRNQIACKCSDGHYETGLVKRARNEKTQKSNLSLELKKAGYIITTYITFAHQINERYPNPEDDEQLAQDYSDTIFWIDEAHNLLIDPIDYSNPKKEGKIREKELTYRTLHRVLHLVRRSKRILSTATPAINDPNEIGSLMNLILPLNGVLPPNYDYRNAPPNDIRVLFPELNIDPRTLSPEQIAPYFRGQIPSTFNFNTATLEDLEPYFRGKIGYIRSADTGAIPEEVGVLQQGEYNYGGIVYQSQLVIYGTPMSRFQTEAYMLSRQSIRGKDELASNSRQASNFVFPDGYWGNGITNEEREARIAIKKGRSAPTIAGPETPLVNEVVAPRPDINQSGQRRAFRRYVDEREDTFTATREFLPWLQDLDYIRNLSCKYAEIVRIVSEEPGNAFVYGEFVKGSGTIVLGLCFEGMGFVRYNENTSMFMGVGGESVKPLCSDNTGTVNKRVRIEPSVELRQDSTGALVRTKVRPYRYALLTQKTTETKFNSMMEAMNSYENRYGDYIKVLISSRVGRDAINVSNVLQIHIMGSEWNQSALYQALSRGIRATSHEALLQEEKDRIRANGGDPETARIPIKIYKHAAISLDDPGDSIDVKMYSLSEGKDRQIKRIMRMMKQCAIGCQIHFNRNSRPGDVDGTPACDYDICPRSSEQYCVDPPPLEADYSTYDVVYADEIIANTIEELRKIYRLSNAFTLNDLVHLLPQYGPKYIIMGIERLITTKTPIIDRFGYTTYLQEDKSSFYLDRTYPTRTKPSYAMSYYTQGVIGIKQKPLAEIASRLEIAQYNNIITNLERLNTQDPQYPQILNAALNESSIEIQANILEEVLIRATRGDSGPFVTAVLNKYQRMIFALYEPITEINKEFDKVHQRVPRKGRRRNPDIKRRTKKINISSLDESTYEWDTNTEVVYLHILLSQISNRTEYAATSHFNKAESIRLYKPSENMGWRDPNDIEFPVYNAYAQIEISRRNQPFEEQGIYGFILPNGKFKISNKLLESADAKNDARKARRGRVCTTSDRAELIDIMYEIGVQEPIGNITVPPRGREIEMIQFILQKKTNKTAEEMVTWTYEKLVYFYKWYLSSSIKRSIICNLIQQKMVETNRMLQ